ncbi:S-layer homology domain-containing protein [Paenibacillus sp. L3-i20]|uniref:S-layer homology domain-containing protein n=1 Tax=Paenibacillus sp. L3-i20 TaxID=2905833 RepID=UPI001EDFE01B|nr:S-layer homology domain-containing protein [Paenibacillus sp. L3-i20]GKU77790.1 hypothetical protein L3i20_v221870 [Paenibacillus sp. L3-i20]
MKERIVILLTTIAIVFNIIAPGLLPRAEAARGTVTKTYTATKDTMEINGHIQYDGIHDNDGDGFLGIGRSNDEFGNVRQRAGITFDLGVPEGSIVSAELVLTVATVTRNPNHTLYMETRGSAANDLNFATFPSLDTNSPYSDKFTAKSTAEVPMGTYLQNQSITFNVKSAVDAFTDISDRKITFMLNGNETDAESGWFSIYSMETSGNAAYRPKLVVTYETGPANSPPTGSFTIVEGAMTGTSTVNLSVVGSDPDAGDSVTHMRFANSAANLSAASWLPFSSTATFSLTGGDGAKTIYMQLRDSNNAISSSSSQTILLDQTAPTGTLIINEGTSHTKLSTVTLKGTYTDGSGSGVEQARLSNINSSWQTSWINIADLNGRSWVLPAGEGAKTVYVQYRDKVGNSSSSVISSTITVDKTAPVITNVENGKVYKSIVTPLFNEGSGSLNGAPYSSGTTITQDGAYVLSVTDSAGNSAVVSFRIDTTLPIVLGVAEGGVYTTGKTITFNEGTATLNGAAFVSGAQVALNGVYTLVVTDDAGNVTTITFEIKKVVLIVTGVTNGGIYKKKVTVSFNIGTATLNGAAFTSGTEIDKDGVYTLVVTDKAGNETTISFTIDTAVPKVTGVTNGGSYKEKVTVSFNEGTAKLNGDTFVSGTEIVMDGNYTLIVTDKAGNETTVSFTIDTAAPKVTGVTNGGSYKEKVTVSFNEGTATLNGAAFAKGTEIEQDGEYKLIVTDAAGNETTVHFEIDTTAPKVTGVTNGGTYKEKVTVSFNEGTAKLNGITFAKGTEIDLDGAYKLVVTDKAGNVTTISFTIDTTAPKVTGVTNGGNYKEKVTVSFNEGTAKLNGVTFVKGTEINQDGAYKLVVTDKAGNETNISFTIDTTAPKVTGVTNGGSYKEKVIVGFNEGTAKLNGDTFVSGTEIVLDGNYTLIVTDKTGNETTISFTIDTTAPKVTGVTNGGSYKEKVIVGFNEGTAKLNGVTFVKGTEINQDGAYKLVVTDKAGNETNISFTIDTTAPKVTGVTNGGSYKEKVIVGFNEGTAKLNGDTFVSGTEIVMDGNYTLIVTDKAGNETTVSFTIDTTAPKVTGVTNGGSYKEKVTVSFNEGTAKLNGVTFAKGTEIDQDGAYTLVVTDTAGNESTIKFQIDTTVPTGTVIIQKGAELTNVMDTTLTLTSSDGNNGSGIVEMRFSNNGTDWESWESSATTKAWSLVTGDGEKTVYVQFKDKAGNVSETINDVIKLDQTIPTGKIVINSGATTTSGKLVALTLTSSDGTGSGVIEMRFSEDNQTWSKWENVSPTKNWNFTGSSGLKNLYVQFRDGAGNVSVANKASITYQESSGSNGGTSESTGSIEIASSHGIVLSIGSKSEKAAKVEVKMVEGKKVTTVFLEETQLKGILNESGNKQVITITVRNNSDIVNWEMSAALLKSLENNNVVIQVNTENIVYALPLVQANVNKWRNQLGSDIPLKDMKIKVEIINVPNSAFVFKNSSDGQVSLVAPPVSFSIKGLYGDKEIELNQFDTFVERRFAIPVGVDLKRITTGVKLLSDGTIVHIPTKIVREGGRNYAILNSMNNSIYGLIYNKKTFTDISNHWAQESINDLASRLVINGADEQRFIPESDITRAEYMAIIIRALGLSSANKTVHFKDVAENTWYHQVVQIGYSYGLVDGFIDGSFKPNEKITRQEAMVILSRAMKLVELNKEIDNTKQQELVGNFSDSEQLASWARQAAALTIEIDVISGYKGELRPLQNITRAETAAIIQRFLQKADFI